MKVGDYCRTEDGKIAKIIDIEESLTFAGYEKIITTDKFKYSSRDTIIIKKSSPNIIDLIEVGDYVNGRIVEWIGDNFVAFGKLDYAYEKAIKSIVTKEQFSQMKYRIGE